MEKSPGSKRAVLEQSAKNSVGGRRNLKSGNVERFASLSKPSWMYDLAAAAYFTNESEAVIENNILSPLRKLCEESGMNYWWASTDFPLHVTFLSATKQDEAGHKIYGPKTDSFYEPVKNDPRINEQLRRLKDIQLTFKDVILNGNNIILAARDIPDTVTDFRKRVSTLEIEHGLSARPRYDILHITIARLREVQNDPVKRSEFIRRFTLLKRVIRQTPLVLTIGTPSLGRNFTKMPE